MEKFNRKDKNGYYLSVAMTIAFGSPCPEGKQHGTVAVKNNRIVSTGYNGPPAGQPHCFPCHLEAHKARYGKKDFSVCPAVHSEINCIITAAMVGIAIAGAVFYVTKRPCADCLKALQNMQLQGVIFMDDQTGRHYLLEGPGLLITREIKYEIVDISPLKEKFRAR